MLARCLEPLPCNYSLIYSLHQELSTYSGVCAQALAGVLIALALVRMMKCIQYEGKIGLVTRVLVGTHSSTLSHDQSLARDGLVTTDTAKRWLSQYCCELAATKSKFGQLLTLTRSSPHSDPSIISDHDCGFDFDRCRFDQKEESYILRWLFSDGLC